MVWKSGLSRLNIIVMGNFKNWFDIQEKTVGSDGMRDNATTTTAQATQNVANKWLGNPQNSDTTSKLVTMGQNHRSALMQPLMKAGANAMKSSGVQAKGTDAPSVAGSIQNSLGLPPVLKLPKVNQVKLMRKK